MFEGAEMLTFQENLCRKEKVVVIIVLKCQDMIEDGKMVEN
jgi:hypothetical protein